jgi:alanine racemase
MLFLDSPILDIDLSAIRANYRLLAEVAKGCRLAGTVKGNGYGLGAAHVGQSLYDEGCRLFFVATLDEGLALRAALPDPEIAVLHDTADGAEGQALAARLTPVLNSRGDIDRWRDKAHETGQKIRVFIHIDTGLNRLGLEYGDAEAIAEDPSILDGLDVGLWISHLACADIPDHPLNLEQQTRFRNITRRLPPAPASLANSPGLYLGPDYHFNIARPGRSLFGLSPTLYAANPMHPVVSLKAPILQVRQAEAGGTVGYGATHTITAPTKIATLALGYADGYKRLLSDRGSVWIGSYEAPVIGRISMDLTTIDVSGVPDDHLAPGALAEIIGPRRTPNQIADEAGTNAPDILATLNTRVRRRYL